MCFHSAKSARAYRNFLRKEELKTTAFLKVVDIHGVMLGSMPVSVLNTQEIANVLRDLKHWHPGGHASLREVNHARARLTQHVAPALTSRDLPRPTGVPHPRLNMEGEFDHIRTVVREYSAAYA